MMKRVMVHAGVVSYLILTCQLISSWRGPGYGFYLNTIDLDDIES